MTAYLNKKTIGFYFTVIAAILGIAAITFYAGAPKANATSSMLVAIAVICEVLMLLVSRFVGFKKVMNLVPSICAVCVAAGLIGSVPSQLDYFGWVVSGLYSIDQIKNYLAFAVLAGIALILFIIASFMDLNKKA